MSPNSQNRITKYSHLTDYDAVSSLFFLIQIHSYACDHSMDLFVYFLFLCHLKVNLSLIDRTQFDNFAVHSHAN